MMATYSPHRDGGGPIHLNSPVQFDPHSAIREIRRSLSRSPSKPSELRHQSFRSMSPSAGAIPFHPSPLSPSKRASSDNFLQLSTQSLQGSRTAPGSRFSRATIRRTAQTQSAIRARTSPKSPTKRVLTDSSDSGNSSPMPLRKRNSTEADRELALSAGDVVDEKENSSQEDVLGWKSAHSRLEKRRSGGSLMSFIAPRSPMKRSEGSTGSDQPDTQSPSAKRRSLHGPGLDFSIFESDTLGNTLAEDRCQDDNDWFRHGSPMPASRFSTIPKRSSSLRKSTLQQRQTDRLANLKVNQMSEIEGSWFDATPGNKKPVRMSLDNHLAPLPRDSPFSSQGSLLNASIHPLSSAHGSQEPEIQSHPRHPLSRTMTQSSSTSSAQDDSPTHEPVHRPARPRSHDFSKSLPIGASRPAPSEHEGSSQRSFATPGNYKSAKPLPAAFMSTGLISKKNRNAEEPDGGLPKAHMPDTPCKKQPVIFPADNKFVPVKSTAARASRQSFGTPSTPLDMSNGLTKASIFPFAKSVGIFGTRSSKHNLIRKASFASIEGEEKGFSQSPTGRTESQSTDTDFPPTPTKHATDDDRKPSVSPSPHQSRTLSVPQYASASIQGPRFISSKLSPIRASPGGLRLDRAGGTDDSPCAGLKPKSVPKVISMPGSSFTQGRSMKHLNSPTPLSKGALATPVFHSPALERAKMSCLSPVSPRVESFDRTSPHTPLEGFFPPDPSGLSISGRAERQVRSGNGNGAVIPATPTAPREYFPNFSNRPSLNLTSAEISDVDSNLTSRFEKVDLVGTGEFSQVYRVSQPPETSPYHKIYSVSSSQQVPKNVLPERVWAVKKSRYPYAGAKDRQRKIHEVDVLKALGHSDHILAYVDSWELQGHLYIQTEFCEEGTLDVFLAQVGLKARLDDFRIWKILLELSLGLKHLHDSGYIHLDLKPANVLITFEGVLKIGDFGMASKWPAKAGIEGEGDREYIGPEILMGKYDKPADIFALGLIMLETAGNVELPDNGVSWQKLRNGDMSDVPSLTWSTESSNVFRDSTGNPLPEGEDGACDEDIEFSNHEEPSTKYPLARSGELIHPPQFMIDPSHDQALERVVRWMISPDPTDRPVANEVLGTQGARWAETRRRAGATIFEGNWGPADEVLAEDAEMIDV